METITTYEGYWNTVLGAERDAAAVLSEFGLDAGDRRGLDEWLGVAETEAWRESAQGGPLPEEWGDYHARALAEIASND